MVRIVIGATAFAVAATGLVLSSAPDALRRPAPQPLAPASASNLAAVAVLVRPTSGDASGEIRALARYPEIASRDQQTLSIRQAGEAVARFRDSGVCAGQRTCERWTFGGVARAGGRPYPWVRLFTGEGASATFLIDPQGALWEGRGAISVAPDEATVVIADPGAATTRGSVSVFAADSAGLHAAGTVEADCQALVWRDARRLAMHCEAASASASRLLTAELRPGPRAGWVLAQTGEIDPATLEPLARPNAPLVTTRLPADAEPALEDEQDVAARLTGYQQLKP
jgi:hypothetical protein